MKYSSTVGASRNSSVGFLLLIALILMSFLKAPELPPAAILTDFRWRKELINLYSSLRLAAGDRVFNVGLIGKNGWYFLVDHQSITEYQATTPHTTKTLAALQVALDQLNAELASQNRLFLVVICPDKTSIYPQYMPSQIPVIGGMSRLDQFVDYMHEHGHTRVLDLRPALRTASLTQQVYFKTDTHWNDLGAFLGSNVILQALSADYAALQPRPLSDTEFDRVERSSTMDLPALMGLFQVQESSSFFVPRSADPAGALEIPVDNGVSVRLVSNPDIGLPRLLVVDDSFYERMGKFIEPRFSQVTVIPYRSVVSASLRQWIRLENPDIVIIEHAERTLEQLLPLLQSQNP